MNWREYEDKSNPIIPHGIVTLLQYIMENAKASLEKSPAMLARGKPMNPTGYKMKVAARKPPKKGEGRKLSLSGRYLRQYTAK